MTTFSGDIETTGLLNNDTIDYSSLPYRLKKDYKLHLVTLQDHTTGQLYAFYDGKTYDFDGKVFNEESSCGQYNYTLQAYSPLKYIHMQLDELEGFVKKNVTRLVGHNFINFDLLALKLTKGFEYSIRHETEGVDSFMGKSMDIDDTLVMSRLQYPDRFGGHSLEELGKKCGGYKVNFRKHVPENIRFRDFGADMVYYGLGDTVVETKVYYMLKEEAEGWDWEESYQLEKKVADIITIQEHFGFKFNKEKALAAYKDLSEKLKTIEDKVLPLLPERPLGATAAKTFTPPVNQIKKNGQPSSYLLKFIERHGGELITVPEEDATGLFCKDNEVKLYDKVFKLPLEAGVPIKDTEPMLLTHHTDVKAYIVSLGWRPTTYNDKDLTIDGNKLKLSAEKYKAACERYVKDTLGTPFEKDRCEHLKCKPKDLRDRLLNHNWKRKPLKLLTLPTYTIDTEKTIDPTLERMGDSVEFVKDIVLWLTYNHRRNAIWSPVKEGSSKKEDTGWLANPRLEVDGRISTPAIPIGANTLRMRHINIVNIPRVTSLYGKEMRELFEVEENTYQLGCDFDSLEARAEGHYTYRYKGEAYAASLTAGKPNDVHTVNSIKMGISRDDAKTLKYSSTFGAQAAKIGKQMGWSLTKAQKVFDDFWDAAQPLKDLKQAIENHWERNDKKWIRSIHGIPLFSRSKHSLLNIAFQSCGAIAMKKALVLLDKKLIDAKLKFHPFEDTWEDSCVASSICMHDEVQLQVAKNLVDMKYFESEEEAEAEKDRQESLLGDEIAEVGHSEDKWYVASSVAGKLCREAFSEAGNYYKLKVPLTGSYNIGSNWAECH